MGVGHRWLLQFMATRFKEAPDHLNIRPPRQSGTVILQRREAEMDELWSFVGAKKNRYWVWIAPDGLTGGKLWTLRRLLVLMDYARLVVLGWLFLSFGGLVR